MIIIQHSQHSATVSVIDIQYEAIYQTLGVVGLSNLVVGMWVTPHTNPFVPMMLLEKSDNGFTPGQWKTSVGYVSFTSAPFLIEKLFSNEPQ